MNELRSFPGNFADYQLSVDGGVETVRHLQSGVTTVVDPTATRLIFDDRKVDLDLHGMAAQVYRLYRAAFGREPDLPGLGYHVAANQFIGAVLPDLAANFLASPEFQQRYGALDNTAFVTQLYANVLGRAPDPGGLAYHVGNLDSGLLLRYHVLIGFSESPENQQRTGVEVKNGVVYEPLTVDPWPQAGYVSVPNDIASVAYPSAYTLSRTSAAPTASPCDVAPARIEFPASSMGRYLLPEIPGAPLAPAVLRGLTMKDVWLVGNPTYAAGCLGDTRQAFLHTLERAVASKVDTIEVIPWTDVDTSGGTTWRIMIPDELHTSTMPDSELVWAAQAAANAGIKLRWVNQIQSARGDFRPEPTEENIAKFLDALEPYLIGRATLLQAAGVDAMQISCGCWFPYWVNPGKAMLEARMAVIAPKIRAVFKGKLYFEHTYMDTPPELRSQVDYNMVMLFAGQLNLSDAEKQDLSVPLLRSKILNFIRGESTVADLSKPMIWRLTFPSRADAFTTGYLEETFCTAGYDSVSGFNSACIQRSQKPDFSMQALFHQAAMEAIAQQPWFQTHSVEVDYWMTDGVQPSSNFPNLATSIRSKPAEAIVRAWYAR